MPRVPRSGRRGPPGVCATPFERALDCFPGEGDSCHQLVQDAIYKDARPLERGLHFSPRAGAGGFTALAWQHVRWSRLIISGYAGSKTKTPPGRAPPERRLDAWCASDCARGWARGIALVTPGPFFHRVGNFRFVQSLVPPSAMAKVRGCFLILNRHVYCQEKTRRRS